ncbi:MAG: hypothetical protein IPO94_17745 [Saprospiraceae bacterium]|nr:hypothetical protein [Saprospiraceae bacterium]
MSHKAQHHKADSPITHIKTYKITSSLEHLETQNATLEGIGIIKEFYHFAARLIPASSLLERFQFLTVFDDIDVIELTE